MATDVVSEADLERPIIRRKKVHAVGEGTFRTRAECGEFGVVVMDETERNGGEGAGPSPLHTVLAAWCGCERVTFHRTAEDFGLAYDAVELEAEYTLDIRGRMGVRTVRPHFQTVRLQATVTTAESEERLAEVVAETEVRCPVYNLLSAAGVRVDTLWVRRSPADA